MLTTSTHPLAAVLCVHVAAPRTMALVLRTACSAVVEAPHTGGVAHTGGVLGDTAGLHASALHATQLTVHVHSGPRSSTRLV